MKAAAFSKVDISSVKSASGFVSSIHQNSVNIEPIDCICFLFHTIQMKHTQRKVAIHDPIMIMTTNKYSYRHVNPYLLPQVNSIVLVYNHQSVYTKQVVLWEVTYNQGTILHLQFQIY